ncbi:hypothetical protein [Methylobacterium persicinum]|uniref:Uncharacterized protein n=1 Tax=Methylobacterium persicinum TaxID=374426 RepID=A0ABU0HKY4_9HYPH|nr:hypothetical protein [Methylobacterium persicinum]MDQ0442985.1 hypothetical protein [Methylobacterium persicinum]GJE40223.1 hypothetical protein KHHGKMAE_4314 [Methylobacterium persicinum]
MANTQTDQTTPKATTEPPKASQGTTSKDPHIFHEPNENSNNLKHKKVESPVNQSNSPDTTANDDPNLKKSKDLEDYLTAEAALVNGPQFRFVQADTPNSYIEQTSYIRLGSYLNVDDIHTEASLVTNLATSLSRVTDEHVGAEANSEAAKANTCHDPAKNYVTTTQATEKIHVSTFAHLNSKNNGILIYTNHDLQENIIGSALMKYGRGHSVEVTDYDSSYHVQDGKYALSAANGIFISAGMTGEVGEQVANDPANVEITASGYIKQTAFGNLDDRTYGDSSKVVHGDTSELLIGKKTSRIHGADTSMKMAAVTSLVLGHETNLKIATKFSLTGSGEINICLSGVFNSFFGSKSDFILGREVKTIMGLSAKSVVGSDSKFVTLNDFKQVAFSDVKTVGTLDAKKALTSYSNVIYEQKETNFGFSSDFIAKRRAEYEEKINKFKTEKSIGKYSFAEVNIMN